MPKKNPLLPTMPPEGDVANIPTEEELTPPVEGEEEMPVEEVLPPIEGEGVMPPVEEEQSAGWDVYVRKAVALFSKGVITEDKIADAAQALMDLDEAG
jgi:hypothetical protein